MKKVIDIKALDESTIAFFNKRAKDTAEKMTPILFTDLYYELNCGPFPTEFLVILWRRLYHAVFEFCLIVESLRLNPEHQNIFPDFLQGIEWVMGGPAYSPAVKSVYIAFMRELEEYKRKHNENLSQTTTKAKGGDKRALCKLVKWDKTWLQFAFVQKSIMEAQLKNDRVFLENLADAIRKKSGTSKALPRGRQSIPKKSGMKKALREEGILETINFLAKRWDLGKCGGLKKLHEDLYKAGVFDMVDEVSPLSDYTYFTKQLRRHKII